MKTTRNRKSKASNTGHSDLRKEMIWHRLRRNIKIDDPIVNKIKAEILKKELGMIWVRPDIQIK
tara:strand:+ start:933 stop:1124 length:192 start_codon:yes stop_codon:yes gene_type:complete